MSQEFFTNLPLELITNILSRLPLRAIMSCKCVCKLLLDLIATREFANSHLPNSVPVLVLGSVEWTLRIFELEDGLNLDRHHLHYNRLSELQFRRVLLRIMCSANGLLLLLHQTTDTTGLYICNPITCEYIKLQRYVYPSPYVLVTYGFGASKITGQYKVVRIVHYQAHPRDSRLSESMCVVYTVGTGSWRIIQPSAPLDYCLSSDGTGAFLNENVHWVVYDAEGSLRISCFDLETECFSTFSAPPVSPNRWARTQSFSPNGWARTQSLCALEDCLCLCENSSYDEIAVWSMKEYGDEKSWVKKFVIAKNLGFVPGLLQPYDDRSYVVHPIKVFKDGDMLMSWNDYFLLYYCNKTKTTHVGTN